MLFHNKTICLNKIIKNVGYKAKTNYLFFSQVRSNCPYQTNGICALIEQITLSEIIPEIPELYTQNFNVDGLSKIIQLTTSYIIVDTATHKLTFKSYIIMFQEFVS